MRVRIIILSLTVSLTMLMAIPSNGLGEETRAKMKTAEQGYKHDQRLVEEAPKKSEHRVPALPYVVMSWRPLL